MSSTASEALASPQRRSTKSWYLIQALVSSGLLFLAPFLVHSHKTSPQHTTLFSSLLRDISEA